MILGESGERACDVNHMQHLIATEIQTIFMFNQDGYADYVIIGLIAVSYTKTASLADVEMAKTAGCLIRRSTVMP